MNRIFNVSKKLLPRISETEMIALRSGTVSIDRNIMENSISLFNFNKLKNTYDNDYINNDLPKIYKSIEKSKVYENGIFNNDLYQEIKNTKAFSFIIDNKYNGHNFNVESQSRNLVKLASVDPALGVTIMVPNSLGPGELLQHYGTEEQKNKYLPK